MIVKIGKFGLIVLLILLMSLQIVKPLAVTEPTPVDLKMLRGDSADFYFQIQAVTSRNNQKCTYSITGMDPLILTFKEDEVTVSAGGVKNVYGTLSVPADAPLKTYTGTVSISCCPVIEEATGSQVCQSLGGATFDVDIVETLEERQIREVKKEEKPGISYLPLIVIIIIIVILAIGVYYWPKGKKKKK